MHAQHFPAAKLPADRNSTGWDAKVALGLKHSCCDSRLLWQFLQKGSQVGCFIPWPDPEQRARQDRPAMPAAMRARAYVDLHCVCAQQPHDAA